MCWCDHRSAEPCWGGAAPGLTGYRGNARVDRNCRACSRKHSSCEIRKLVDRWTKCWTAVSLRVANSAAGTYTNRFNGLRDVSAAHHVGCLSSGVGRVTEAIDRTVPCPHWLLFLDGFACSIGSVLLCVLCEVL